MCTRAAFQEDVVEFLKRGILCLFFIKSSLHTCPHACMQSRLVIHSLSAVSMSCFSLSFSSLTTLSCSTHRETQEKKGYPTDSHTSLHTPASIHSKTYTWIAGIEVGRERQVFSSPTICRYLSISVYLPLYLLILGVSEKEESRRLVRRFCY